MEYSLLTKDSRFDKTKPYRISLFTIGTKDETLQNDSCSCSIVCRRTKKHEIFLNIKPFPAAAIDCTVNLNESSPAVRSTTFPAVP